MVYPCMCCTAVPLVPRPSHEEFMDYAKKGMTDQVAEALRDYSDLISIQDSVSCTSYKTLLKIIILIFQLL